MRKITIPTIALSFLMFANVALAEISIIVHPSNNAEITTKDVVRMFLGKQKRFSDGQESIPVHQDKNQSSRTTFVSDILKKDEAQLKAFWSRLIFTGKGNPPKSAGTDADILKLVASNPNLIGYIDSSLVDGSVKAINLNK